MDKPNALAGPAFTQPIRQIVTMLVIIGAVASGVWLGRDILWQLVAANLWLNGAIALVFALGVLACLWQMVTLSASVTWIKGFAAQRPGYEAREPPSLLAPLAALLAKRAAKMQISTSSNRSILDSVAARLDEVRDITRYLGNLLIFLGLLGTFYGLATSIPAMVDTIRSLAPAEGESGIAVFGRLMSGLESQLGGMGTAFSSSLMGLAGSLVVGLLDLFAGHGQNRFFRELEEWLSSITRLGFASGDGEGTGDAGLIAQALEEFSHTMSSQMDTLHALLTRAEIGRSLLDERIGQLAGAMERMVQRVEAEAGQATLLRRIAEGQDATAARLIEAQGTAARQQAEGQAALAALLKEAFAAPEGGPHVDAESRMRLRSIDVQLLRILEEISAGRQESTADLRNDLAALTSAIRQLSRGNPEVR
jgi:hypothetical protein